MSLKIGSTKEIYLIWTSMDTVQMYILKKKKIEFIHSYVLQTGLMRVKGQTE